MIVAQHQDLCFSFASSPRTDSNLSICQFLIGQLFGAVHSQHSVSYLEVKASHESVRDLFGSPGGTQAVTGIRVTGAVQTVDLLQQFAPARIEPGTNVVLTVSRLVGGKKLRIHLTFGDAGAWEEAVVNGTSLLAKLSARCVCVRIASLMPVGQSFAQEWRRMFPAAPTVPVPVAATVLNNTEALQKAEARIAELEEELNEANRKLTIRENTLVNVLIGSHPAFHDLADYPRRNPIAAGSVAPDKENGRSNHVEFHSSVPQETSGLALPSSTKKHAPPSMMRTLSSASASGGGAVRVAKVATPSATRKASVTMAAAPLSANKPGVQQKKKPIATPGPGKTRSRVF